MIKLVNEKAEKKFSFEDSVLIYTEILPRDLEKAYQKWQTVDRETKEGVFDIFNLRDEILNSHVVGWENVVDTDGTPVPFSSEFIAALPSEVRTELYSLITTGKPIDR